MSSSPAVPVLMYHKVGIPVRTGSDRFLNVSGENFRRQMQALVRFGYQARTFAEIAEAKEKGLSLPRKVFAVTFDDGYGCVGEIAAPILRVLNIPATVFVVSQGIGRTNAWDSGTGHAVLPLMDEISLRQCERDGWEIAGHTRTHPHLDKLEESAALQDILEGRRELEAQFGTAPTTFCYPFGHYNSRTPELVRQAGYCAACTTQSGLLTLQTNPFLIPRVKIAYRDGVFGLFYRMLLRPNLPTVRRKRRDLIHTA